MALRILFLADSHLGFDQPVRPRVRRRRRGQDFLANYLEALVPAFRGDVDLVVHGGDVFHRARVPPSLAYQALEPLRRVADQGIPVLVVPGNHERSRIPHARFAAHPRIHVFHEPGTCRLVLQGRRVALCGFPYERGGVRERFGALLSATGWRRGEAHLSLLCMHHCVEGATVGPTGFTFRDGPDVIRGGDVPGGFAAVLTGHVHRHQVLTCDLSGRPLTAPVFYPGSVERTAFAEKDESKGYLLLEVAEDGPGSGGTVVDWRFRELPTRPMIVHEVGGEGIEAPAMEEIVRRAIADAPPDAVLRLRITGYVGPDARSALSAPRLRSAAPATMNVGVVFVDESRRVRPRSPGAGAPTTPTGAFFDSLPLGSGHTGRSAGR